MVLGSTERNRRGPEPENTTLCKPAVLQTYPPEQAAAREREKAEDEATARAAEEAAKEVRAAVVFRACPERDTAVAVGNRQI